MNTWNMRRRAQEAVVVAAIAALGALSACGGDAGSTVEGPGADETRDAKVEVLNRLNLGDQQVEIVRLSPQGEDATEENSVIAMDVTRKLGTPDYVGAVQQQGDYTILEIVRALSPLTKPHPALLKSHADAARHKGRADASVQAIDNAPVFDKPAVVAADPDPICREQPCGPPGCTGRCPPVDPFTNCSSFNSGRLRYSVVTSQEGFTPQVARLCVGGGTGLSLTYPNASTCQTTYANTPIVWAGVCVPNRIPDVSGDSASFRTGYKTVRNGNASFTLSSTRSVGAGQTFSRDFEKASNVDSHTAVAAASRAAVGGRVVLGASNPPPER